LELSNVPHQAFQIFMVWLWQEHAQHSKSGLGPDELERIRGRPFFISRLCEGVVEVLDWRNAALDIVSI
jgi:hypothetical protein